MRLVALQIVALQIVGAAAFLPPFHKNQKPHLL